MNMKKLLLASFMTMLCGMAHSQSSFTINTDGEFVCNEKNYLVIDYKGEKCDLLYKKFTKGSKPFKKRYVEAGVELGIDEIRYFVEISVAPYGLSKYDFHTIIEIDFKDEKIRIAPSINKIIFNGGLYHAQNQRIGINHFKNKKGQFKLEKTYEVLDPVCNTLNYVINDILSMAKEVNLDDDW